MANITLRCKWCSKEFVVEYKYRNKRKFCNIDCMKIGMSGFGNPAYGKTYRTKETHPEWAEKVSNTHKSKGSLIGDKNPMKNPVTVAKMSNTRRKTVTNDPAYRASRKQSSIDNWAEGKYDNASVGKCKWYDHQKSDGSIIKLQGTWEVAFARELDTRGIDYEAHRGRLAYISHDGSIRNYYPDFYITMWDAYVDIKGAYWDELQKTKFEYIKKSHPDKCIVIGNKEALKEWNVDYVAVQRELL